MSDNYEDILNRQWDDIPEVTALPVGSWLLKLRNASYVPSKGEASPRVMFVYSAREPMDDVDTEELAALGDNYDISANKVFFNIWIEDASSLDAVRRHVAKHGVEVKGSDTLGETLKAARGSEIIAYLGQRTFTNAAGEQVVDNNPTNFTSVDA